MENLFLIRELLWNIQALGQKTSFEPLMHDIAEFKLTASLLLIT